MVLIPSFVSLKYRVLSAKSSVYMSSALLHLKSCTNFARSDKSSLLLYAPLTYMICVPSSSNSIVLESILSNRYISRFFPRTSFSVIKITYVMGSFSKLSPAFKNSMSIELEWYLARFAVAPASARCSSMLNILPSESVARTSRQSERDPTSLFISY